MLSGSGGRSRSPVFHLQLCSEMLASYSDKDQLELFQRLAQARMASTLPFFMDLIMIASWEIWRIRNDKNFRGKTRALVLGELILNFNVIFSSLGSKVT